MPQSATANILTVLDTDFKGIIEEWLGTQVKEGVKRSDLFSDAESRNQNRELLKAFSKGVRDGISGEDFDFDDTQWDDLRAVLADVSRERVNRGVTPTEMATFVLALKAPLFKRLEAMQDSEHGVLIRDVMLVTRLVDAFAIYTNEIFILEREQIIDRQRQEMLELSTPVVELWDRVLTLPLIGTLDSARAQEVMENLLQTILERQAEVVIMDITGVGTVDTQVAQHLLRAAAAVRLMGAECIISGISPMIAQTMVQLGIDVGTVSTRSSIRTALSDALLTVGYVIKKTEGQ
ncbi:MAG: STAS domain-containing protein [Sulfitobacter sp.]|mgnify:FL=1|jgi:rsbT co-antagonist protein RsbR|uniref:STAS domain-containing protein n=1 Tax=Sulfitobacter profundi TaxID=2679961 RepID=A0ABW1Z093_9RHOB|nr:MULTISPECIES: STAS domain-containing protein [Sulfitobacter]KZZ30166.1 anti-anti-sigma factor [Sulfitobacter sp. HI0082]AYE86469.1 anti-anti-sigma factor [Sulfitobacter sp. D7]KZX95588.1 anti-anti-sigma factor [Sulfitobacter sp. HI0021]KZX99773.1 anti-anti-sigma factor [Sulfitobacter sp. HI0027]KZY99196.1 anti-anti-sigma factor [Sulfitobacter sp. HI0076]|tara:strand:+ start:4274 stop:5149 length:876 start_codon:yes stop_codon:yes gene_type:complete